jgi:hypothetical protein
MNNIPKLTQRLIDFRIERNWEPFYNLEDLVIALSFEVSELLEAFLLKIAKAARIEMVIIKITHPLTHTINRANRCNLCLKHLAIEKLLLNGEMYPLEKAKSSHFKFNEL